MLDRFDQKHINITLFEKGPFPRNQPYMAQADWITQSGGTLSLKHEREAIEIEADVRYENLARIPGIERAGTFQLSSLHSSTRWNDGRRCPPSPVPGRPLSLSANKSTRIFSVEEPMRSQRVDKLLKEVARVHGVNPETVLTP